MACVNESLRILGVRVDDLTAEEAIEKMEGFLMSGTPHQVVTINPEFIIQAQEDALFRQILEEADLAIPDGVGLLWASRLLGRPLRARVTGIDTMKALARLAAHKDYGIFLLGGGQGVAAAAAQVLKRDYPGLPVVGTYAGSPHPQDEEQILELIRSARPQMLFVAYGAPAQDRWIRRNLLRLGVPLAMGVGGAFDFLAGEVKRAPPWMQHLGLEWLYRLVQEPWRWRRMLRLPRFLYLVLLSARRF